MNRFRNRANIGPRLGREQAAPAPPCLWSSRSIHSPCPGERHLFVTEWFSTSEFKKHHQVDSDDDERFYHLRKVYAENMAEHRQNAFRVGLASIECGPVADGKLQFDFSRFDKLAQVFWDTGRMDLLETGFTSNL